MRVALAAARRDDSHLALLFIDLDRFKPINDRLGHAAGDRVLKGVAERIRHNIRESDTAARIGGDEFVASCAACSRAKTPNAWRTRSARRSTSPSRSTATASAYPPASAWPFTPRTATTPLSRHADAAMYRAKDAGKPAVPGR